MKIIKSILANPFFVALLFYAIATIFIQPFGNYAVNDDWGHSRQVNAFLHHSYRITANTDAVLILQAVMGFIWVSFFGFSLVALKILTFVVSLFLLFFIYKILILFDIRKGVIFLTLSLVIFNPLIFHLSVSFMTDIYFLAFFSGSLYFYLKGFKKESKGSLFFGTILCGCAILVRQLGIVIFTAYSVSKFFYTKSKKQFASEFVPHFLIFALFVLAYGIWPRYIGDGGAKNFAAVAKLLGNLVDPTDLKGRFVQLLSAFPYFGYFIFPFALSLKVGVSRLGRFFTVFATLILSYVVYRANVFPIGNILYLEGFYAKATPVLFRNFFSSNIFKLFIAFIISVSLTRFLWLFIQAIRSFKNKNVSPALDIHVFFIFTNFLGMYLALFIGGGMFDRYLLPATISLLLINALYLRNYEVRIKTALVYLGIFALVSIFLQKDYVSYTKIKWKQALALSTLANIDPANVRVDATYAKYFSAQKLKDYSGIAYVDSSGSFKCFSEEYVINDSWSYTAFNRMESFLKKYIYTPKIYKKRLPNGPYAWKNKDSLIFNEEYFSPLYNLLDEKVFVAGWCSKEILPPANH